jgi:hypothetical protein
LVTDPGFVAPRELIKVVDRGSAEARQIILVTDPSFVEPLAVIKMVGRGSE